MHAPGLSHAELANPWPRHSSSRVSRAGQRVVRGRPTIAASANSTILRRELVRKEEHAGVTPGTGPKTRLLYR